MPPESCPDCGAVFSDARTCQMVFHEFLALEFSDPAYGAVHLLTVACYMIQHGQYSDAALVWIESKLRDVLEKGRSPAEIRRLAADETGQSRRAWPVTRRPGDPPQARLAWSQTLADVARQAQDPARYCAAVEQWARATLREMQPLLSV